MVFPESPRVVYDRNPLDAVICQLRFPPILRIDSEPPAAFQERIRREYPMLNERPGLDLGVKLPAEVVKLIAEQLPPALRGGTHVYDFSSPDDDWKVTLSRDFVALTASAYRRWEDFRARLVTAAAALVDEYAPPFYTRVGLRYRNVIRRSEWGLDQHRWADLLTPHIAGPLASPPVAGAVSQIASEVTIELQEEIGKVRVKHGLVQGKSPAETGYLIDSDFFNERRTEVTSAPEQLDYYNREAGRLFRWCIEDRLHHAMGPRGI
jgi:uncharacterized protein (TIGR04255 family)